MISIVMPVYNAAEYLGGMLDSVIRQSYTDIEIILVNDGSTDNSSIICHRYADKYNFIKVYDRENHGVSATRNFGVEQAQGDFIWFMDSDDELETDALQLAVDAQKKYDADIVIGGMNFCFPQKSRVVPKVIDTEVVFSAHQFKHHYKELFSSNYISSLCNKLIRRSVIIDNNIKMDNSLCMYEDYVYCMDVILNARTVVCLKDIFYNYQLRNSQSLSHKYKARALDMFCILQKKITGYMETFGNEAKTADRSLNDLIIYIAYECLKNEARHNTPYKKVRKMLRNENFHKAMLNCKGYQRKYRIVQAMMKRRMALPLLVYFTITKKTNRVRFD